MLFKDENGAEFKKVTSFGSGGIVIKPVKAEPKYEVLIIGNVIQIIFNPKPPQAQAQLIKEAIEALMGVIFEKTAYPRRLDDSVLEIVNKARHSIRGDK